jgi:hypothetical protein
MIISIGLQWNYIKQHRFEYDKVVKYWDGGKRSIYHFGPICFSLAWDKN